MGRVVEYYNERYKGSLQTDTCDELEHILKLRETKGACEADLLHIIYDMADNDVEDMITSYEEFDYTEKNYPRPFGTLRNEQTLGVAYLYHAKDCILGDSVGLGKTVQVAGLVNLLRMETRQKEEREFRYLLVTEKSLVEQVRRELVKFTGEFVSCCPSGEADVVSRFVSNNAIDTEQEFSVVGTHGLLSNAQFLGWLEQCRRGACGFPFDMIIVDESSPLGGKTTNNIVKGYKAIGKYFKRHVFLNATPFETKVEIFYNQLSLLDKTMLPVKTAFQKQYCVYDYTGMYPKTSGKYKNQSKFKHLIGYRYLARTRKELGAVSENNKGGILLSPLSPIQKAWLKRTQLNRMVYDCPCALDSSIEFDEEHVPKLTSIRQLLETEVKKGEPVLIFVHYKEAQAQLSKWLDKLGYTNRVLNGATKTKDRGEIVEGFKKGEYQVLLTNVQKGLNFGGCNFCIFYSFDPNPSRMIQFEGRTTRQFDIRNKQVYILCSEGKEYKTLVDVVKQRAVSTDEMTNTDLSLVMQLLTKGEVTNTTQDSPEIEELAVEDLVFETEE